ncbi:Retrovirus-related Pol polyprotein from transposon RE1 [Bienertia sinuspersici]
MITCLHAFVNKSEWIIDSGASDHMVCDFSLLRHPVEVRSKPKIALPNGKSVHISHMGEVLLKNGMKLKNVMYVPDFKQNLMSVNRLIKQTGYNVVFNDDLCIIQDSETSKIEGVGRAQNGMYYLMNEPTRMMIEYVKKMKEDKNSGRKNEEETKSRRMMTNKKIENKSVNLVKRRKSSSFQIWHNCRPRWMLLRVTHFLGY